MGKNKEKKEKKEKKTKLKKGQIDTQQPQDELIKANENLPNSLELNKSTLKDLLPPSGIDASH